MKNINLSNAEMIDTAPFQQTKNRNLPRIYKSINPQNLTIYTAFFQKNVLFVYQA